MGDFGMVIFRIPYPAVTWNSLMAKLFSDSENLKKGPYYWGEIYQSLLFSQVIAAEVKFHWKRKFVRRGFVSTFLFPNESALQEQVNSKHAK